MRKQIAIYKRGRRGRNDWHQRAAEFHDLAAHAHRVAATHHNQGDHQTGHELSKQAVEYSGKAYLYAKEAHKDSTIFFSGAAKTASTKPVKLASGAGKPSIE